MSTAYCVVTCPACRRDRTVQVRKTQGTGLCIACWREQNRFALASTRVPRSLRERFFEKVAIGAGPEPAHCPGIGNCDLWTGAIAKSTLYGVINRGKRGEGTESAHVVAFFLAEGRWPDPCCLHVCDVRNCVRRSHLFEGTLADNNWDMIAKGRYRGCAKMY
jgi:hypothetical protein